MPCPVCGSEELASPAGVTVAFGGISMVACGNCGNFYNKDIAKNYRRE